MKKNLNCNYEVVNSCDIKNFNKEVGFLKGLPYSKITIPEILSLPKEKPPIKSICKICINIEVNPDMPITENKLLITGNIIEKVVYNSNLPTKSLNSVEFKIPFSTYILINEEPNINNNKFSIKSCIDDVFATTLSEYTIFQSTTLFLFAEKTPIIPPTPPPPLPSATYNAIIINSIDNKEVATIKFDLESKIISVQSTGEIPNKNIQSDEYFSLTLRTTDNFIEKFSVLETSEDASDFSDDFNNTKFAFDESIELRYIDSKTITITNLPDKTQSFNPTPEEGARGIQNFLITEKGLIETNN